MRAIFLSDLHLTTLNDQRGQCFLGLLQSQRGPRAAELMKSGEEPLTHLFLVGDIFDLWFSDHDYFLLLYASATAQIQRLINEGVQVHYFEGNHDLHLDKYWGGQLGVQVHPGPAIFQLNGLKFRIEHGDQMDPDDRGYRLLRWLLRTQVMTWMAHHLPSSLAVRLGERASRTSRTYTSTTKVVSDEAAIEKMHRHARLMVEQEPLDFLVHGHVHVRDDFQFEHQGRQVRSINLGSWLGETWEYLELRNQTVQFNSAGKPKPTA